MNLASVKDTLLHRLPTVRLTSDSHTIEARCLRWILVVALIHGLIYVFFAPPWEHYDEPGHFEYAWIAANWDTWPKFLEFDESVRSQISHSMIDTGFFDRRPDMAYLANLRNPTWIGETQLGDPPLYYFLVSLPLRLARNADVQLQLILGRLVSLGFFMVTIYAAWRVVKEMTPEGSPIRWMVPLSMALLPPFVDLMTAVNNDSAAVVLYTLFLWNSLRLIKRGLSLIAIAAEAVLAVLCFLTKNTVMVAVPLAALAVWLSLFRTRFRFLQWALPLAAIGVVAALTITGGQAIGWIPQQPGAIQGSTPEAPFGSHTIQLSWAPSAAVPSVHQIFPSGVAKSLQGKTVTVGVWMWATEPTAGYLPWINAYRKGNSGFHEVSVGTTPAFYASTFTFPPNNGYAWLTLMPLPNPSGLPVTVYYDGMILIEGEGLLDSAPVFTDPTLKSGSWGDRTVTNLLRNPSAESGWIGVRPRVDYLVPKFFPGVPSTILAAASDLEGTSWYLSSMVGGMARSFWGFMGWGGVRLLGHRPFRLPIIITLLGLTGALFFLYGRRPKGIPPWPIFLGLAMVLPLCILPLRGYATMLHPDWLFYPLMHYGFPVILPVLFLLNAGWYQIFNWVIPHLRLRPQILALPYFLFWGYLIVNAFMSQIRFYFTG